MKEKLLIPAFHKGDIVELIVATDVWSSQSFAHGFQAQRIAWRRATSKETEGWYALNGGMGDDGEMRLAPRHTHVSLVPARRYLVLKGRTSAERGYSTISNCCEILDPVAGEVLTAERIYMKKSAVEEAK